MTTVSDHGHYYIAFEKIVKEIVMIKKEQAEKTQAKLFETAVGLFKEFGYENVTVSQICREAGVAKGTFYVHYQAKEDIVKDSYYADMGDFVIDAYDAWRGENPSATIKEKVFAFLLTELKFSAKAGLELTCRAFVINLSECIHEKSRHFERRAFSKVLKDLLLEGIAANIFCPGRTVDELFLCLESFVRGLMASWCFANGEFDIIEQGERELGWLVDSL